MVAIRTWEQFLGDGLGMLLSEDEVEDGVSRAIIADVCNRANDYSGGGSESRRILRISFYDDVASFEPRDAPIGVKADTAVVVRNSLLEDAHSNGSVSDSSLTKITLYATGLLNQWLREHNNHEEKAAPVGLFAGLTDYSLGFAVLKAMALAAESGGRKSFQTPVRALPPLFSEAKNTKVHDSKRKNPDPVHRSALSQLDEHLLSMLNSIASGERETIYFSSLSRISRNSLTISQIVDFVIAHGGAIVTTNFLIRPGEAFARRPPFIAANSWDPMAAFSIERISGVHAKYIKTILASTK